ncbi:hypothetical protein, partial [Photobacterium sp. DNB22_13_2]
AGARVTADTPAPNESAAACRARCGRVRVAPATTLPTATALQAAVPEQPASNEREKAGLGWASSNRVRPKQQCQRV